MDEFLIKTHLIIFTEPWIGKAVILAYLFFVGFRGKVQTINSQPKFRTNPSGTVGQIASLIGIIALIFHYKDFKTHSIDTITTYCVYALFCSNAIKYLGEINDSLYTVYHKFLNTVYIILGVFVIWIIRNALVNLDNYLFN